MKFDLLFDWIGFQLDGGLGTLAKAACSTNQCYKTENWQIIVLDFDLLQTGGC